ncbi:MAG: GTPase Era [Caldilineaceae bacterium]
MNKKEQAKANISEQQSADLAAPHVPDEAEVSESDILEPDAAALARSDALIEAFLAGEENHLSLDESPPVREVGLLEEVPADHRSGYVAVVGRPNVGKSTLLNRIMGQKIAITSPKPQTTREQLMGILTEETLQIVFLDTPGIHKPQHKLGEYMVAVAEETIKDADVVLWLVDVNYQPTEEDQAIALLLQQLQHKHRLPPLLLVLNQVDRWHAEEAALADRQQAYLELLIWLPSENQLTPLFLSAQNGKGVPELLDRLRQLLPLGPRYYPAEQLTDMQTRFIVAELIREQALTLLQQEVPHGIAVEVDEFKERSANMTYISAVVYVERRSQKGIVLGENGKMIREIGRRARPAIEDLVGTKVYLELWVKVWEKWRKRSGMLRQLGYALQK